MGSLCNKALAKETQTTQTERWSATSNEGSDPSRPIKSAPPFNRAVNEVAVNCIGDCCADDATDITTPSKVSTGRFPEISVVLAQDGSGDSALFHDSVAVAEASVDQPVRSPKLVDAEAQTTPRSVPRCQELSFDYDPADFGSTYMASEELYEEPTPAARDLPMLLDMSSSELFYESALPPSEVPHTAVDTHIPVTVVEVSTQTSPRLSYESPSYFTQSIRVPSTCTAYTPALTEGTAAFYDDTVYPYTAAAVVEESSGTDDHTIYAAPTAAFVEADYCTSIPGAFVGEESYRTDDSTFMYMPSACITQSAGMSVSDAIEAPKAPSPCRRRRHQQRSNNVQQLSGRADGNTRTPTKTRRSATAAECLGSAGDECYKQLDESDDSSEQRHAADVYSAGFMLELSKGTDEWSVVDGDAMSSASDGAPYAASVSMGTRAVRGAQLSGVDYAVAVRSGDEYSAAAREAPKTSIDTQQQGGYYLMHSLASSRASTAPVQHNYVGDLCTACTAKGHHCGCTTHSTTCTTAKPSACPKHLQRKSNRGPRTDYKRHHRTSTHRHGDAADVRGGGDVRRQGGAADVRGGGAGKRSHSRQRSISLMSTAVSLS